MRRFKIGIILFIITVIGYALAADFASASSTDGTIDSTYKYAWSENTGWINFHPANSEIHITDSGLSGYALSETIGWIYLGDITNDGEGNLSGYAWSENTGWIKFNPTNGGVIINSSGEFTGSALGENIGWIIFSGDYKVKTDWRPQSARPAASASASSGGPFLGIFVSPLPPAEGFKVLINGGVKYSGERTVTLTLRGGSDTAKMAISNFSDFHDASPEPFQNTKSWTLTEGEGAKTVFVKFYTLWGYSSAVVSAGINYKIGLAEEPPEQNVARGPELPLPEVQPETKQLPKKTIIQKALDIIEPLVPGFLKPKPPAVEPPAVPIEELVPKETPVALRGEWNLLSQKSISEFVLAPLPQEINKLAQKLPQLKETFSQVGINKMSDLEKLIGVKLALPGLTEATGLSGSDLSGQRQENLASLVDASLRAAVLTGEKSVPLYALPSSLKAKIPEGILFLKTAAELIDYKVLLSLDEKGEPQQETRTIAGKPLILTIKPEPGVLNVRGFVVFKSKQTALDYQEKTVGKSDLSRFKTLALDSAKAATVSEAQFGIEPKEVAVLVYDGNRAVALGAKTQGAVLGVSTENAIEERLVLQEFTYSDPDGDGIYTAEIMAPVVDGEYEIITVMDYEVAGRIISKEVRMKTVVDPEGYVYEKNSGKETRVPGAVVSIFRLNPQTKQYELWSASEYQQENPQVTDLTGKYSFLVPGGTYYLNIEAPGYLRYEGKSFAVQAGPGVHFNIELMPKNWWLKALDWKAVILFLVVAFLIYNFYKDKIREKRIKH